MRSIISVSEVALGFTILICTICTVMCLENESGPQDISHEFLQPTLNDRYLRNYYEMYHDGEPVWKRAPAAGFFGMRGKKVSSSSFYGMRGKKGPSGFLGVRGKKQDPMSQPNPVDLTGNTWASLKLKGPSSPGGGMDAYDDYSLFGVTGPSALVPYKRATADGFMALRGKRSTLVVGQPASSYKK